VVHPLPFVSGGLGVVWGLMFWSLVPTE
jgi:hypothetical protein